jgi:hypothetical protein
MFAPNPQRSLLETLLLGAVIVGVGALGAVYGAIGCVAGRARAPALTVRRFPLPWSVEELARLRNTHTRAPVRYDRGRRSRRAVPRPSKVAGSGGRAWLDL